MIRELLPLRLCLSQNERAVWSLLLSTGTPADKQLGRELDSSFWEGVARWILLSIGNEDPEMQGAFEKLELDANEDNLLVVYGEERSVLAKLGAKLARLANDGTALTSLVQTARASGVDFDE